MQVSKFKGAFIQMIKNKRKVSTAFYSQEGEVDITYKCALIDFGSSGRARGKGDWFHLWDYEENETPHITSIVLKILRWKDSSINFSILRRMEAGIFLKYQKSRGCERVE